MLGVPTPWGWECVRPSILEPTCAAVLVGVTVAVVVTNVRNAWAWAAMAVLLLLVGNLFPWPSSGFGEFNDTPIVRPAGWVYGATRSRVAGLALLLGGLVLGIGLLGRALRRDLAWIDLANRSGIAMAACVVVDLFGEFVIVAARGVDAFDRVGRVLQFLLPGALLPAVIIGTFRIRAGFSRMFLPAFALMVAGLLATSARRWGRSCRCSRWRRRDPCGWH